MKLNEDFFQLIHSRLESSQRIMIVSHSRPDGDAIGSLLALGLGLIDIGKNVQMVSADGVPLTFKHLDGSKMIRKRPNGEFDLIISVDSAEMRRFGNALDGYPVPDLNIDHHITNKQFAEMNIVDTKAVATAEMLAELMPGWSLNITKAVASALLTGIVTDTLGFRTSNVTSKALRLSANLMERGADLSTLYKKALIQRSFEAVRLWAAGLNRLERDDRIVWTSLTIADRESVGYPGRDDADLVNLLSAISDISVAIIFVEQPNGCVKISWRARSDVDITGVALDFGGGGHPAASGAEVEGDLEKVLPAVLNKTREFLNG